MLSIFMTVAAFIVTPFGKLTAAFTGIATVLGFLNNPIIRVLLYAALVMGAYMVGDVRGRLHEHKRIEVQVQKDTANAVTEANQARNAAVKKFDSGRYTAKPRGLSRWVRHGSDGFSRD